MSIRSSYVIKVHLGQYNQSIYMASFAGHIYTLVQLRLRYFTYDINNAVLKQIIPEYGYSHVAEWHIGLAKEDFIHFRLLEQHDGV